MSLSVLIDPRGGHNRSLVNQDFFKTWSPSMAYILGFIFADGAIEDVQKSSRTCYLSFSVSISDKALLLKIKAAMNSQHKLYIRKRREVTFYGKTYISKDMITLRVGSKTIYNDLIKLGLTPRKSLTVIFPKIPVCYLNFFIRGYFDDDGCIYLIKKKYPIMTFTSGSIKFLEELSTTLAKILSIPIKNTHISHNNINPCYQLKYNITHSRLLLDFIYQNIDLAPYLERKFLKYSLSKTSIKNQLV